MELQRNMEHIVGMEIVDETIINQEELGELIIPESQPEVTGILDIYTSVLLKSKEAEQGRTVIKGIIQTTVIYTSHDDNIYRAELPLSYTVMINNQDINQDCEIAASVIVTKSDALISDGRKIIVKAAYRADVKTFCKHDVAVCSEIDDDSIFQLNKNIEITSLTQYTEKTFVISDDITINEASGSIYEILGAEYTISHTDYSLSGNRLILRGFADVELQIMFSDDVTPKKLVRKLDYSQIIDIDDADKIDNVSAVLMLNGVYLDINSHSDDAVSVNIELHAVAQCEIYRKQSVQLLCDAYSTNGIVTPKHKECVLITGIECFAASSKTCERFENFTNVCEITSAKINVLDYTVNGTELNLKCILTGYGFDAEYTPQIIKHSFSLVLECRNSDNFTFNSCIQNIEVFGNEIIFEGNISAVSDNIEKFSFDYIEDVEFETSDNWSSLPSAVLCRYDSSVSVWELAKKYLSAVDIIKEINNIDENETIEEGRMLLVPKV